MRLVSGCLLGINCKYSGKDNRDERVMELLKVEVLIPVCPEQLGGMTTPRAPAEIAFDKVINEEGLDLTSHFVNGALETLKIANLYGIKEAILKDSSPSCGSKMIYDGNFSKTKIKGEGYCTRLLRKNGINVISENDL